MSIGASMEVNNVTKIYKNNFKAVDNVSLNITEGEFLTILGPSGSGKSTLLKLIAGFESISEGSILLNNEDISKKEPHNRNIGMLFQNYALFPHMTVFDNVGYSLKIRKIPKNERTKKVKEILELVHLTEFADRHPNQLSGGQQQRVALARSMVFNPPILLLDEPLGALDKQLRQKMQLEIKHIQETLGITTISVTHDQEEALTMSDRICVMNEGKIMQVDTPDNLYRRPANHFVAQFIGEINLISGNVMNVEDDQVFIQLNNNLPHSKIFVSELKNDNSGRSIIGKKVSLAIRPEDILVSDGNRIFDNEMDIHVTEIIYMGDSLKVQARSPFEKEITLRVPHYQSHKVQKGETLRVGWNYQYATYVMDEENAVDETIEHNKEVQML